MSEYIFKPRCTDDFELDERDATNPVDWYGTLHGEIVRCRDCICFTTDELGDYCTLLDFEDVKSMANGFCAWGKQKEGE